MHRILRWIGSFLKCSKHDVCDVTCTEHHLFDQLRLGQVQQLFRSPGGCQLHIRPIRSIWPLHFHSVQESSSWSRVAFLGSTHKRLQIFQGFGYHWLEEIACIICTWLSVAKNLGEISLASNGCKKFLILFQLGKHCTRSFVMQIRGFCFFNECHPPNPLQRSRCFQSLSSNSINLMVRVSVKGNQHQEQLACILFCMWHVSAGAPSGWKVNTPTRTSQRCWKEAVTTRNACPLSWAGFCKSHLNHLRSRKQLQMNTAGCKKPKSHKSNVESLLEGRVKSWLFTVTSVWPVSSMSKSSRCNVHGFASIGPFLSSSKTSRTTLLWSEIHRHGVSRESSPAHQRDNILCLEFSEEALARSALNEHEFENLQVSWMSISLKTCKCHKATRMWPQAIDFFWSCNQNVWASNAQHQRLLVITTTSSLSQKLIEPKAKSWFAKTPMENVLNFPCLRSS